MNSYGGAIVGRLNATTGARPTITIYDFNGDSLNGASPVGFIVPEFVSASVSVQSKSSMTENYQGDISAVHFCGTYFEASLRMKPFAEYITNIATTAANALKSATLLQPGFTAVITGMPIVRADPFTDIWNVGGTGTQLHRWVIFGGNLDLSNSDAAGSVITLRRFPSIVATSQAIVS